MSNTKVNEQRSNNSAGPPPTKRYSWEQLNHIINVQKDLSILRRNEEDTKTYGIFRAQIRRDWRSVLDYILYTKFQWGRRKRQQQSWDQNENEIWEAVPPSNISINKEGTNTTVNSFVIHSSTSIKMVLCRNDFPYYVEENIDHWILWKLDQGKMSFFFDDKKHACKMDENFTTISDEEIEQAKLVLKQPNMNKNSYENDIVVDTLHWINPPHLKSIPEIDHVHILVLLEKNTK